LGAALRRAESSGEPGVEHGERARPRAHIRRAHWHTFRVGEGRRGVKVKWVAPIPVKAIPAQTVNNLHKQESITGENRLPGSGDHGA
jgi:hypothetical protein